MSVLVAVIEPVRLRIIGSRHQEIGLPGHHANVVAVEPHLLAVGRQGELGLAPELELGTAQVVPQSDLRTNQTAPQHVVQRRGHRVHRGVVVDDEPVLVRIPTSASTTTGATLFDQRRIVDDPVTVLVEIVRRRVQLDVAVERLVQVLEVVVTQPTVLPVEVKTLVQTQVAYADHRTHHELLGAERRSQDPVDRHAVGATLGRQSELEIVG